MVKSAQMKRLLIVFLIAASGLRAQPTPPPSQPPSGPFANLPAASGNQRAFTVTNCLTASCTGGGGTLKVLMISNGSAWAPSGSGGGGSGVTSVTIAGTTGQITATGTCTGTTTISCTLSLPSNVVLPGTLNSMTITTSTGTFTLANAKVLTVNNTMTLSSTDSASVAFGAGGTVLYAITGGACTNQVVTSLSTAGLPTCSTVVSTMTDTSIAIPAWTSIRATR